MLNLTKKGLIVKIFIILAIFLVGFILRVESVNLHGIPDSERDFYQDQNNLPYMYELDSYYHYRLTENYINHGYLGDIKVNGTNWDLHSFYPPGRSAEYPPLIVYVAALFYYILNIFADVPLMVSCFYLPAVLGPLSGVVAYLLVRRFTNDYGAVAAGIFVLTAPFYFIRTVPGWFDTDMFIVLFPLLIMWFIAEAVYTKNTEKRIFFTVLSSFSTFLFSYAWEGWAYVFYITVFSFLVYTITSVLFKFKFKNILQVFTIFTGLTTVLIATNNINTLLFPFNFIMGSGTTSWPNILLSVSEMHPVSIEEVISSLGYVFFAGILSPLWIFRVLMNKKLKEKYLNRMTWFFYLFIIIWTITGFLAIIKGVRFIMILLPPIIVSSGIMVGICTGYFDLLKKNKRFKIFQNKNFTRFMSLGVICLVALPGIINTHDTLSILSPMANDDLWAASEWIKNNTCNDTVIISKWCYGYLLSAVSNRAVSVDGGSQNSPRTYWIDRAFSSSNWNLSQGIFRMVAASGDSGPLTLDNYTENTTRTVEILNKILGIDKDRALIILTEGYGLSLQESQKVLNYTHPDNPRPYVLVTTRGMINTGRWTFYFGLWDFNKMEGYHLTYSPQKLNRSDNLSMDLKSGEVNWNGKTPYFMSINRNGRIERKYVEKSSNFSFFFIEDYNKSIIMDNSFENSLFTKLVIERSNSTNFKPVHRNKNVIIWKPIY